MNEMYEHSMILLERLARVRHKTLLSTALAAMLLSSPLPGDEVSPVRGQLENGRQLTRLPNTKLPATDPATNFAGDVSATDSQMLLAFQQQRIRISSGPGRGGVSYQSSSARRSSFQGTRPLFGSSTAHAARRHSTSTYQYNRPLVTSREVARASVQRSVYGSRWGW